MTSAAGKRRRCLDRQLALAGLAATVGWARRETWGNLTFGLRTRRCFHRAVLRVRDGDWDVPLPPPPRARAARTERDVANDVVFGVVAVDLLFNHDRLDVEVGSAFERSVYKPVMRRLRVYADSNSPQARAPAKSWRLQDRTLEKQFSLSCFYTQAATSDLQISRLSAPFLPRMQHECRNFLNLADVMPAEDPVSNALIAWTAYNVWVGEPPARQTWIRSRGRPWGYAVGKPEVSEWLLPVFVEHDRSAHAERMALLMLGDLVKAAGGRLYPDSPIGGAVSVYCSHTPCISCMAVFCQFKRQLPRVGLQICFDRWGENKRWIGDGSDIRFAEVHGEDRGA
eukprot:TRINITY_DN78177_c0_g1_i1.p1 TRINITY_DN78177_c0_g1~~TRINITY_DN78177_c0_g1_i1.p1  ORF type:complete len:350 (-),score=28.08 TRINITY_DN78177_c0_g1_i1:23-1042(-)